LYQEASITSKNHNRTIQISSLL